MDVKVVICSNHQDDEYRTWSLENKLEFISNQTKIHFPHEYASQDKTNDQDNLSGIFLVPEYFFNAKETCGRVIPLSNKEKKVILDFIRNIQAPGLLIVPGSFAYKKENNPTKVDKTQSKWTTFCEKELFKYPKNHQDSIKTEGDFNISYLPESPFYAKNSAYCFLSSNEDYIKISKISACTDEYENTAFISGITPSVFKYGDVSIGLSICRDAIDNHTNSYDGQLDLEIIISDYIFWKDIRKPNRISPKLIIHASTAERSCGILQHGQFVSPIQSSTIDKLNIDTYKINIPTHETTSHPTHR